MNDALVRRIADATEDLSNQVAWLRICELLEAGGVRSRDLYAMRETIWRMRREGKASKAPNSAHPPKPPLSPAG